MRTTLLLVLALLHPSASLAVCPARPTMPADDEVGVPTNLARFYVNAPGPRDGTSSPHDACVPVHVVITGPDGVAIVDENLNGVFPFVPMTELQAGTTYEATVTVVDQSTYTTSFTTGDGPAPPNNPAPLNISAVAERSGEYLCGSVSFEVEAEDEYSVLMATVGQPAPWRRSIGGRQAITLSTTESPSPSFLASPGDEVCYDIYSVSVDGMEETVEHCVTATAGSSVSDCAYNLGARPEQTCAAVGLRESMPLLLAQLGVLALARRRRRRRSPFPR